jgi:hypothetical protein
LSCFARLYLMVVVLYVCNFNMNSTFTFVLDGRPSTSNHVKTLQGIHLSFWVGTVFYRCGKANVKVKIRKGTDQATDIYNLYLYVQDQDPPKTIMKITLPSPLMNMTAITQHQTASTKQSNEWDGENRMGGKKEEHN